MIGLGLMLAGLVSARLVHADASRDVAVSQRAWVERYEHARALLVKEDWVSAARELSALEVSAPSGAQRLLASELAGIARAKLSAQALRNQPALRTQDELVVLYTSGVMYGLGTAAWLALQLQPATLIGALLPFAVLTPAAVGVIAVADHYRPLRHGIPHAIAAGMYLGLGEGLWLVGYQSSFAVHRADIARWSPEQVSTALWIGSTAGALAGGLIGALRRPTPGRVSLAGSAAIWGGVLSALVSSSVDPGDTARSRRAFAVGALGYNVALVAALLFGPSVAPSVARVRFTDLGGLFGALLGGGLYSLLARGHNPRLGYGLAAAGGMLGLGATFWATRGMPADRSHDALPPAIGARPAAPSLRTWFAPMPSGVQLGMTYGL